MPSVRVSSAELALFAAETVYDAGIPVVEITLTVPGAIEVISQLTRNFPACIVGAGTVLDAETAQRCVDAGARFITEPRAGSGCAGIHTQEQCSCYSGSAHSQRSNHSMEGRCRFCEDIPLCSSGWRSVHPSFEGPIATNSFDRVWRRRSTDRG